MTKLLRPHIPISVRLKVAQRQVRLRGVVLTDGSLKPKQQLRSLLYILFGNEPCHLDHDPALGARRKILKKGVHVDYDPPANDPRYLIYRTKEDHRVKTLIRGEHGQYSDRMLINRHRRRERASETEAKARRPKMKSNLTSCRLGQRCSCARRDRRRCKNWIVKKIARHR